MARAASMIMAVSGEPVNVGKGSVSKIYIIFLHIASCIETFIYHMQRYCLQI